MNDCNPNKVPLKTSVNLDEIATRLPRTPHPEIAILSIVCSTHWRAYQVHRYQHSAAIYQSWADIVPQRKSSLSCHVFCNNAVFSWKSSLSSVLAVSSEEAELNALCACVANVAYCRNCKLANELGFLQLR
jgi:hypothetical protein